MNRKRSSRSSRPPNQHRPPRALPRARQAVISVVRLGDHLVAALPGMDDVVAGAAPCSRPNGATTQKVLEFLHSGGRVVLITGPPTSGKTRLLHEIASAFEGGVFKVANPLTAPLSLTRIMVQANVMDDGGDEATLLRTHLARYATPETPALLAIDDAHTLDDEALSGLAGLALHPYDGPGVVLLLAGSPELTARMDTPAVAALSNPQGVFAVTLPRAEGESSQPDFRLFDPPVDAPMAVPPPPPPLSARSFSVASGESPPALDTASAATPVPPRDGPKLGGPDREVPGTAVTLRDVTPNRPVKRYRTGIFLPAMVILLTGVTGAAVVVNRLQPAVPAAQASLPEAPVLPTEPVVVAPPAETGTAPVATDMPAAGPASELAPRPLPAETGTASAVPPAELVAPRPMSKREDQLRREFQAFLARTGRQALARDPSQFETLFHDYLQWRSGAQSDRLPASR